MSDRNKTRENRIPAANTMDFPGQSGDSVSCPGLEALSFLTLGPPRAGSPSEWFSQALVWTPPSTRRFYLAASGAVWAQNRRQHHTPPSLQTPFLGHSSSTVRCPQKHAITHCTGLPVLDTQTHTHPDLRRPRAGCIGNLSEQ